jgi:hypothetical protein
MEGIKMLTLSDFIDYFCFSSNRKKSTMSKNLAVIFKKLGKTLTSAPHTRTSAS